MNIPRKFLIWLILFNIASICIGVVTIASEQARFDGIIVDSNGNMLSVPNYLNSDDGQNNMAEYINKYINSTILYTEGKSQVQFEKYNRIDSEDGLSVSTSGNPWSSDDKSAQYIWATNGPGIAYKGNASNGKDWSGSPQSWGESSAIRGKDPNDKYLPGSGNHLVANGDFYINQSQNYNFIFANDYKS